MFVSGRVILTCLSDFSLPSKDGGLLFFSTDQNGKRREFGWTCWAQGVKHGFFSRGSMGLVYCASCKLYAFLLDDERKTPSMAPMAFLLCLLPLSWRWSFSLLVTFLTIFASLKTPTWLEHMINFNHLNLHLMKLLDLSYLNDMLIVP